MVVVVAFEEDVLAVEADCFFGWGAALEVVHALRGHCNVKYLVEKFLS